MTLDRALEILVIEQGTALLQDNRDSYNALSLGTEAIKRLKDSRLRRLTIFTDLLPGESEDYGQH